MFEDIDDKFELDLITDSDGLFDNDNENITESEIKMNRRKTLYDVSIKFPFVSLNVLSVFCYAMV